MVWSCSISIITAEQRIGVAKHVACNEDVSCSLVNMGHKLLRFAIAKSLFPPL